MLNPFRDDFWQKVKPRITQQAHQRGRLTIRLSDEELSQLKEMAIRYTKVGSSFKELGENEVEFSTGRVHELLNRSTLTPKWRKRRSG